MKNKLAFLLPWSFCVLAGLLLGIYLTSTNIHSNKNINAYWDDVETTEAEYEYPDTVSVSDTIAQDEERPKWCLNRDLKELETKMRSQYESAYKKNKDIYAWIYFPSNTREKDYINEGLYWDGTSYYLHINSGHHVAGGGQIFVEPKTDPNTSRAVLIHGHNMINESHLGAIKYLTDEPEFSDNRLIYIYYGKEDAIKVYATFSCVIFPANKYLPQEYMYSEKTEQDYIEYVDTIAKESMFQCEYEYNHVISLHTCNRAYKGAHLLLSGYCIEDDYIEFEDIPLQ